MAAMPLGHVVAVVALAAFVLLEAFGGSVSTARAFKMDRNPWSFYEFLSDTGQTLTRLRRVDVPQNVS